MGLLRERHIAGNVYQSRLEFCAWASFFGGTADIVPQAARGEMMRGGSLRRVSRFSGSALASAAR